MMRRSWKAWSVSLLLATCASFAAAEPQLGAATPPPGAVDLASPAALPEPNPLAMLGLG